MLPTCMSVMTRSGGSSATTARTSSPAETSRTAVPSSSKPERTSATTEGESLTTRTSGTTGGYLAEEVGGDEVEPVEVVHVVAEVGHLDDRSLHPLGELGDVAVFIARDLLQFVEIAPEPVEE